MRLGLLRLLLELRLGLLLGFARAFLLLFLEFRLLFNCPLGILKRLFVNPGSGGAVLLEVFAQLLYGAA